MLKMGLLIKLVWGLHRREIKAHLTIFVTSVLTSPQKFVSTTKTNRLILFGEIKAVYFEKSTNSINVLETSLLCNQPHIKSEMKPKM
jgi:hypothetical protein